ncbi:MAG: hypothetical protein ACJASQ_003055 [Crocinitomicaceae bacterium]|jgi:hypothetical protein
MNQEDFDTPSYNWYMWECRYRGYYHYPYRVPLEIPFHRFQHTIDNNEIIDDGYVPSFFEKLWKRKEVKTLVEEDEEEYKHSPELTKKPEIHVIELSFSQGNNTDARLWVELLEMLSLVSNPLSFEIIGTGSDIKVQVCCYVKDYPRVSSHIKAFLPSVILSVGEQYPHIFDNGRGDIAIADLGLEYESMLPINTLETRNDDPLRSIIAFMDSLNSEEVGIFQILFQGIKSPLGREMMVAVSDGAGGSFFNDDNEMLQGAQEKVSSPLFSCVMRIATQGRNKSTSKNLCKQLLGSLEHISDSGMNNLIALSNLGYSYKDHVMNIFRRQSNRPGMTLNSRELALFLHYPSSSIVSPKLDIHGQASKQAPYFVQNQKYALGSNTHQHRAVPVSLSDEQRLSHTHIIGVTGAGKSTLLARLFLEDVEHGNGCVMIDPHGDIIDDILLRIPKERAKDVIILDPSDTDFPIGFNVLHAESEAERIVLSSDLVATFKRYATSWGDRMTSVLSNAIDTFLDSERGGTLIELKRFLLEKTFRTTFLKSVSDPQLLYYWKHDFVLVPRASLTPLLIRLDTFLRPKIVRMMMAQREGLDISKVVRDGKILLVKLSQGLIGEENARLLGTLIVTKLGQVALGRQALAKEERKPFYIHMDEFHHLITPTIADMVSGVRKYGVGLTLAHQDLTQLGDDKRLLRSVVSNPNIRMCFRLSYEEAKVMELGFTSFSKEDLVSLERGQVIMRVGGAQHDFNLKTEALEDAPDHGNDIRSEIIKNSRENYARKREDVEELLRTLLPTSSQEKEKEKINYVENIQGKKEETEDARHLSVERPPIVLENDFKKEVKELKEEAKEKNIIREHEHLKASLSKLAQDRGFRVVLEEATESGGRVDIGIHADDVSLACEISCTNTPEYEMKNIHKCLEAKYSAVFMVSKGDEHLKKIEALALKSLSKKEFKNVFFFHPDDFLDQLQDFIPKPKSTEKIIKGYRVKVNYSEMSAEEQEKAKKTIAKTVLDSMKKKKK